MKSYNHNCIIFTAQLCVLFIIEYQLFMNLLSFSFPYRLCLFSISLTALFAIPQEVVSVTVLCQPAVNAYSIMITVIMLLLLSV